MSDNTAPLLKVSEAAKVLDMGEDMVRALVRSGKLKHVKPGKRNIYIPRVAINEYIISNMQGGTQ